VPASPPPALTRGQRERWQFVRARARLYIAIAVGIAVALLLPAPMPVTRRAVIGWDCGIVLYLVLILVMAAQATPRSMLRRATLEDSTRWVFLGLMAGAAWFSMFALLGILHDGRDASGHLSIALALLAGATILLSWVFAHTAFAVHYAHDYYADVTAERPRGAVIPRRAYGPRLLGLPLFFIRRRHDLPGVRRSGRHPVLAATGAGARRLVVPVQHRGAGVVYQPPGRTALVKCVGAASRAYFA
jgi:hypothetical protein